MNIPYNLIKHPNGSGNYTNESSNLRDGKKVASDCKFAYNLLKNNYFQREERNISILRSVYRYMDRIASFEKVTHPAHGKPVLFSLHLKPCAKS